jgi:hypothetical protein
MRIAAVWEFCGGYPGAMLFSTGAQWHPYILWHFLLTPQVGRATIRANVVLSVGAFSQITPLGEKNDAVSARVHRSMH